MAQADQATFNHYCEIIDYCTTFIACTDNIDWQFICLDRLYASQCNYRHHEEGHADSNRKSFNDEQRRTSRETEAAGQRALDIVLPVIKELVAEARQGQRFSQQQIEKLRARLVDGLHESGVATGTTCDIDEGWDIPQT